MWCSCPFWGVWAYAILLGVTNSLSVFRAAELMSFWGRCTGFYFLRRWISLLPASGVSLRLRITRSTSWMFWTSPCSLARALRGLVYRRRRVWIYWPWVMYRPFSLLASLVITGCGRIVYRGKGHCIRRSRCLSIQCWCPSRVPHWLRYVLWVHFDGISKWVHRRTI